MCGVTGFLIDETERLHQEEELRRAHAQLEDRVAQRTAELAASNDSLRRLLVKPGITGLWQVSGRSDTGYGQRVELDAAYVSNWSLTGDVRILFRTVIVVIKQKGAM